MSDLIKTLSPSWEKKDWTNINLKIVIRIDLVSL